MVARPANSLRTSCRAITVCAAGEGGRGIGLYAVPEPSTPYGAEGFYQGLMVSDISFVDGAFAMKSCSTFRVGESTKSFMSLKLRRPRASSPERPDVPGHSEGSAPALPTFPESLAPVAGQPLFLSRPGRLRGRACPLVSHSGESVPCADSLRGRIPTPQRPHPWEMRIVPS